MIAKFAALVCLIGVVRASGWHGGYSSLGYGSSIGYGLGGYSTYVAPSYTAPIVAKTVYAAPVVTKAVVPTYSYAAYAPAISTVSRYQVHSSPVVKSYVPAPIVKSYVAAPIVKSYVAPVSSYSTYAAPYSVSYGHDYNSGYSGYAGGLASGYSGYGYGGYGGKYLW